MLYENDHYYLLRKPRNLPTTFGEEKSLLDYFQSPQELVSLIGKDGDFDYCLPYFHIEGYKKQEDMGGMVIHQTSQFSKDQEFGLLNRLDNATGGFLYFAKTPEAKALYKDKQSQHLLQKVYLAEGEGNPFYRSQEVLMEINTPIMHHATHPDKMISCASAADQKKGRGQLHQVSTQIQLIHYNSEKNTSLLQITIAKGVRHQIRVHLASIGCPIIGDVLYGKSKEINLHLRSIGIKQ